MKSNILMVIFCFILVSCNSLVKKINGEKKPKAETQETLQQFISENNLSIDLSKNIFLKNKESKEKITHSEIGYLDKNNNLLSAYGIYFFDENWNALLHNQTQGRHLLGACLKDEIVLDNFHEKIISLNNNIDPKFNLLELKNSFIDSNGNDFFPFQKNGKAVAIVVWSKYKGKKWAVETEHLIRSLKNSKTDYNIYYLNLDPNKFYSQF